jgi:hypothetical protein
LAPESIKYNLDVFKLVFTGIATEFVVVVTVLCVVILVLMIDADADPINRIEINIKTTPRIKSFFIKYSSLFYYNSTIHYLNLFHSNSSIGYMFNKLIDRRVKVDTKNNDMKPIP